MKRCFAIVVLSVFLITYLLPIATLVKADVVIGDNNEVIVNENAHLLGRKLALMESIPNLLNNGVTSITISNTNDLDEYLDSLWNELGNAVDYLTNGDWASDLSFQMRNEALENITNYINYVGDRENIFANLLRDPTTQLLKEYVIGNNLPKTEYRPNYNTLNTFRRLSYINSPEPTPQPDPNYASYIDAINGQGWNAIKSPVIPIEESGNLTPNVPLDSVSWHCPERTTSGITTEWGAYFFSNIYDIVITSNNGVYSCVYNPTYLNCFYRNGVGYFNYGQLFNGHYLANAYGNYNPPSQTFTGTLQQVLYQLSCRARHCNIYVDGVLWSSVGSANINPQLDIDGFLTIYGDDNPPQYNIQTGTQIDYDMLYDTIYNAIINALPIDQQDITYYDSHDTVYSPTIINNYGSDPDGESEWIESILDYAVVPDFKTSLLAPIETPLVNGLSVMVTVQDTIPEEILYVLGAVFVLLLFVCVINKMTK